MINMAFIILTLGCLSVIVVVAVVIVALYLQNRQANKETGAPTAPPKPAMPIPAPSVPTGSDLETQVRALMARDQEIEAIKVYRKATNAGLKDAKDAVEAIGRGMPAPQSPLAPVSASDLEGQVGELLVEGKKIEAIKRYRELTGAGLADAKAAVEAFEQGQPLAPVSAAAQPAPAEDLDQQVRSLLQQGLKINAIKVYREATGAGLAEAKTAVEAIEREMKTGAAGAQ